MLLSLLAASLSLVKPVVCIDPGHPSEVGRGTQGKKLTEMRAAWTQALLVRDRLTAKGIRVVLTKPGENVKVRNRARAEIANRANADLMLRLHCDAANGSGFTSYYPDRQGKAEGVRGPSRDVIQASRAKARAFHAALSQVLKGSLVDNGLKPDVATAIGGKQGALTGSVFSKVPVVLVEMVVLTNRKDEAFLLSSRGQRLMADGLTAGVLAALKVKARH